MLFYSDAPLLCLCLRHPSRASCYQTLLFTYLDAFLGFYFLIFLKIRQKSCIFQFQLEELLAVFLLFIQCLPMASFMQNVGLGGLVVWTKVTYDTDRCYFPGIISRMTKFVSVVNVFIRKVAIMSGGCGGDRM